MGRCGQIASREGERDGTVREGPRAGGLEEEGCEAETGGHGGCAEAGSKRSLNGLRTCSELDLSSGRIEEVATVKLS